MKFFANNLYQRPYKQADKLKVYIFNVYSIRQIHSSLGHRIKYILIIEYYINQSWGLDWNSKNGYCIIERLS